MVVQKVAPVTERPESCCQRVKQFLRDVQRERESEDRGATPTPAAVGESTARAMVLSMMPALLPSKLPSASEVQRQVAAARQKSKSLPTLRSPPRRSPRKAAAPRQQRPPLELRALLPRELGAGRRSEFSGPDRTQVLIREDALAPTATRVVFKPADPAQQRFVTAQHNQVRNFMGHHDLRAVVSEDDALAQQCREAFQRRRRGLTKSKSEPPRKLPELQESPLQRRVNTVQPMPFGPPVVRMQPFSLLHLDHSTSPSVISPPLPASPPLPLPGPSPLAAIVPWESSSSRGASASDLLASSLGHGVQGASLGPGGHAPQRAKRSSKGSLAAAASVEGEIQLLSATGNVAHLTTRIVDTEIDSAVGKALDSPENTVPSRMDSVSATEARKPSLPLLPPTARRSPVPPPASVDGPAYWQGQAVSEWGLPQADAVAGWQGQPDDADAILGDLGATEYLPPRKATAGKGEPRKSDGQAQDISGWGPGP